MRRPREQDSVCDCEIRGHSLEPRLFLPAANTKKSQVTSPHNPRRSLKEVRVALHGIEPGKHANGDFRLGDAPSGALDFAKRRIRSEPRRIDAVRHYCDSLSWESIRSRKCKAGLRVGDD